MDRKQARHLFKGNIFEVRPPTIGGKIVWDGVYHGPTDPVGPIGPHVPADISNGL